MPFDSTTLRGPTVTVLPPAPPERGEPPHQRIRIEIEIIDRQPSPTSKSVAYRFGMLTLWLIVMLAALVGCGVAHAQPSTWQSYREGFLTRHQGTDANGGQWTGNSYKQGFMTYFEPPDHMVSSSIAARGCKASPPTPSATEPMQPRPTFRKRDNV